MLFPSLLSRLFLDLGLIVIKIQSNPTIRDSSSSGGTVMMFPSLTRSILEVKGLFDLGEDSIDVPKSAKSTTSGYDTTGKVL